MKKSTNLNQRYRNTEPIHDTMFHSPLNLRKPSTSYTAGVPPKKSTKSRTDIPKTDSKRVIIEPGEIVINIDSQHSPEEKETVIIRNLGTTPMFFRSRSTNMDELRMKPNIGFIDKFDCETVSVLFKSNRHDNYKRNQDRLTIEWIRLNSSAAKIDFNSHVQKLQDSPPEQHYKRALPVTYKITQVNNVTSDDIAAVKAAFVGTPSTLFMVGDFEAENVTSDFTLTNGSPRYVIWRLTGLNNTLLTAHPKQGILMPNGKTEVSIVSQKFHVGTVSDICDTAHVEWTAVVPEITEFSSQLMDEADKVYRVLLTILYEYTGMNENTQRSESFRKNRRAKLIASARAIQHQQQQYGEKF